MTFITGIQAYDSMKQLFTTSFPNYYHQPQRDVDPQLRVTNEIYFEIEDQGEQLRIHVQPGDGTARIENQDALDLLIFNYEAYINGFNARFQQNKKRCDFVLASDRESCFVLGELKNRNPFPDVAEGARRQLLESLQTIDCVPEIHAFIMGKQEKRCCYFNKQSQAPPEIEAVVAFNRINQLMPNGIEMPAPEFHLLGFRYFEYYENQTMKLTA